jgi:hypothetical protein
LKQNYFVAGAAGAASGVTGAAGAASGVAGAAGAAGAAVSAGFGSSFLLQPTTANEIVARNKIEIIIANIFFIKRALLS